MEKPVDNTTLCVGIIIVQCHAESDEQSGADGQLQYSKAQIVGLVFSLLLCVPTIWFPCQANY